MNSFRPAAKAIWFVLFAAMALSVGWYAWLSDSMVKNLAFHPHGTKLVPEFIPSHAFLATAGWFGGLSFVTAMVNQKVKAKGRSVRPIKPETSTDRIVALFLSAILIISVGGLGFWGLNLNQNPSQPSPLDISKFNVPTLRPFLIYSSSTILVIAWLWLRLSVDWKTDPESRAIQLTSAQFLSCSAVALFLAQACVIIGLAFSYLGSFPDEFRYFAAETLLFNFVFILPRGLKFWSTSQWKLAP